MKLCCLTLYFLFCFNLALAQQSETLSVVVELETKVTEKIRSIILPVDPDAIIYTNVNLKKIDTDLTGTQMSTLGFMATSDIQKIDDADIQSIEVSVLSSKPEFPKEVSKLVETVVLGISKKGKVSISKMETNTFDAIQKNKEWTKMQAENFQKIGKYAENFYQLLIWFGILIFIGFASIQFINSILTRKNLAAIAKDIVEKIAMISENSSPAEVARPVGPAPSLPEVNAAALPAPTRKSEMAPQANILDQLNSRALLALLSDAYWCKQDNYAAWLWLHLNPKVQLQLLEAWTPLAQYVRFLDSVIAVEDSYHFDSCYLNPADIQNLSNESAKEHLTKNPEAWGHLSSMRRKSLPLSIKERIDFSKYGNTRGPVSWPAQVSAPRELPQQLEVSMLTENDERSILEDPFLIPEGIRANLPSLVWLYLCPVEIKQEVLQSLPAQSLAEIWIGPEEILSDLELALPDKKKALLKDYISLVKPNRSSPILKQVTLQATQVLKKLPESDFFIKKAS